MIRKLRIMLEDGQEVQGESHIFSDEVYTNDELPGHIVMTYYVQLPTTHPMFNKLVGFDRAKLEDIEEQDMTRFIVEVQRGLVLTREQYDSLDSYEETVINDRAHIDDLYIEVVGYLDSNDKLIECEGTIVTNTIKQWVLEHDASSMASTWAMLVRSKPFAYAVPHITKMTFIKE